jgi:hypothetical protein
MASDGSVSSSIKKRLRSSAEAFAEHSLETAKDAAKGLENTHAAYIYPLEVLQITYRQSDRAGNLLLFDASSITSAVLLLGADRSYRRRGHCCLDLYFWISPAGSLLTSTQANAVCRQQHCPFSLGLWGSSPQ